jgi:hypothetical protein
MGADENDQTKSDSVRPPISERIEEQLEAGWRIVSLTDGQLLLVPPPTYGDPPGSAA